jgi:hypothetical protein
MQAAGADLLPIDHSVLWCPDVSQATPGVLNDLNFPAEYLLDPLNKTTFFVGTIGPDQLESGEETSQRFQQEFATMVILDIGFMDEDLQDQADGIDKQMSFAPLDGSVRRHSREPPFLAGFH